MCPVENMQNWSSCGLTNKHRAWNALLFFFLLWLTSMIDSSQEESEFMEVTQTNHASANSPDFTVLSNLNVCAPLHLFYGPFKLLGFQLKRRFISLRPDLPLIYTTWVLFRLNCGFIVQANLDLLVSLTSVWFLSCVGMLLSCFFFTVLLTWNITALKCTNLVLLLDLRRPRASQVQHRQRHVAASVACEI